jgi:D-alanine-D-alanine ligase-like ATP-grasp enzyme
MKRASFLGNILKKIAPKIGAKVLIEPKWGVVCQVTFRNGKKCYFRYNTLDLNTIGASEIAVDKDYASFFMKRMGYPTIPGRAFFSKSWAKAIGSDQDLHKASEYAQKLGFPLIVKPNSKSQGSGVALVHNKTEFYRAMRVVFTYDKIALVQKYITGKDYRLVVLDKRVISAYERVPLSVVGDGVSSVRKLLQLRQEYFVKIGRDTRIRLKDPRILEKLKHQSLTMSSVLKNGQKIYLLDNANLSTGGDSVDVTDKIHPFFRTLAIDLTRDMGLRLCGVDLLIDGDITTKTHRYHIIEINAAPGLDHYASMGKIQEKIVEDLYLEVLKSIEK